MKIMSIVCGPHIYLYFSPVSGGWVEVQAGLVRSKKRVILFLEFLHLVVGAI